MNEHVTSSFRSLCTTFLQGSNQALARTTWVLFQTLPRA
jgi:hypothetical protein